MKQAIFLSAKCTSLLRKPVQRNFLHVLKILKNSARSKVKETKLTSRKVFIVNVFALESEKESKYD